jgi:hypothetical protein
MHLFLSFSPFAIIFLPRFLLDTRYMPKNPSPPSRELFMKIRRFSPQERPPAQCRKSAFGGLYLVDCDRVSQMFHKYAAGFFVKFRLLLTYYQMFTMALSVAFFCTIGQNVSQKFYKSHCLHFFTFPIT